MKMEIKKYALLHLLLSVSCYLLPSCGKSANGSLSNPSNSGTENVESAVFDSSLTSEESLVSSISSETQEQTGGNVSDEHTEELTSTIHSSPMEDASGKVSAPEGTIRIHFETGDPSVFIEDIEIEPGQTIEKPYPSREGYALRRWVKNGEEYDFSTPIKTSMILTAEWVERTNLPTFLIELKDPLGKERPIDEVNREEYVDSAISLTDEDGLFTHKSLKASFRGRGNGSWADPKKCFRIKFHKKQSLFGRTANKHWVLLACANFDDTTLMRNYTAYNMAGTYFSNLEYTTNAVFVDLYVNGEYRGVYVLAEHVRVGKGRVDIKSEYGVDDTGYLIEYDAYAEGVEDIDYFDITGKHSSTTSKGHSTAGIVKYNFTLHSPDPGDYATEGELTQEEFKNQIAFIKDYVKRVYTTAITNKDLDAFSELVDMGSLIDLNILNEFYKNTDVGYSSFYMYKKPGGKLYFGPAWDFDGTTVAARGEENNPNGIYVGNTAKNHRGVFYSELFVSLYGLSAFQNLVKQRYNELKQSMESYYIGQFCSDFYKENRFAMGKNFLRWGYPRSSRVGLVITEDPKTQQAAEEGWIKDCGTLRKWFLDRILFLNQEWKLYQ